MHDEEATTIAGINKHAPFLRTEKMASGAAACIRFLLWMAL